MQPAQNRKQFTKKKKKNVLLQQAKFLQGKNNSLDIFKQMQVCKLCWNVFCHAALCIGMYFAYPLCAFSVNKQPCGTHPKSALYFSFEINFRLVAVFESASDNEPTGARVAVLFLEEEPPPVPTLEDNEGRLREYRRPTSLYVHFQVIPRWLCGKISKRRVNR